MKNLNTIILYSIIMLLFVSSIGYTEPARQDTVTKYYSISPTAFDPEYHGHMWQKDYGRLWSYSTDISFFAPVYLPDSAQVIEFKVWVFDSFPTHNITVSLYRSPLGSTVPYNMATVTSVAGAGDQELTDATIDYNPIDNTAYKYCIRVGLYADDYRHSLYGVRIKYEIVQGGTDIAETSKRIEHAPIEGMYPTPFAHETTVRYAVSKKNEVSIKIYDEAGRLIRTLINETMNSGSYTARWDGKDNNGRKVAEGSYFCVVKTNGRSTTKVVHIK